MNFKSWIYLFLIVVFTLISWVYYTHNIKGFYGYARDNERIIDAPLIIDTLPSISFNYNDFDPILSGNFERYRDSLCQLANDKNIEIIGFFDSTESNTSSMENIGLARASKIKNLFSLCMDSNQLSMQSLSFKWGDTSYANYYSYSVTIVESNKSSNTDSTIIFGSQKKYIVQFPSKISEELSSANLKATIKKIAKELSIKYHKIYLIGSSDNLNVNSKNYIQSFKKCLSIKKQFFKEGVLDQQIDIKVQLEKPSKVQIDAEQNQDNNSPVQIIIE